MPSPKLAQYCNRLIALLGATRPTVRLFRIFCISPRGTCLPMFFATLSTNPSRRMILPGGEDRHSIGFFFVFAYKIQATVLEHRSLLTSLDKSVLVAWRFFSCCCLAMLVGPNNASSRGGHWRVQSQSGVAALTCYVFSLDHFIWNSISSSEPSRSCSILYSARTGT